LKQPQRLSEIFSSLLDGLQEFLLVKLRRRMSLSMKAKLGVGDDPIDDLMIFYESDDSHLPSTLRTDRGHEFQAQFHWHVEDKGMRHVYIKPRSPQLNGKVKRSLRTDQEEFYQLLTYTDDVDLNEKLSE
jgi:transposase InsO family protein